MEKTNLKKKRSTWTSKVSIKKKNYLKTIYLCISKALGNVKVLGTTTPIYFTMTDLTVKGGERVELFIC